MLSLLLAVSATKGSLGKLATEIRDALPPHVPARLLLPALLSQCRTVQVGLARGHCSVALQCGAVLCCVVVLLLCGAVAAVWCWCWCNAAGDVFYHAKSDIRDVMTFSPRSVLRLHP